MQLDKLRIRVNRSAWIAIFTSAALLAVLVGYFFSHKKPHKEVPPVYEEIYSISDTLNETISQIDYAIYKSFYRIGVKEREVSFLQVIPKHQNERIWEFTELLIKMPYSSIIPEN